MVSQSLPAVGEFPVPLAALFSHVAGLATGGNGEFKKRAMGLCSP